jgi:hypothetical protein
MSELFQKTKRAFKEGRLVSALKSRVHRLKYIIPNPASDYVTLHCPDYVEPSSEKKERTLVDRIFQSFRKMKNDQKNVSSHYLPSSQWQEHLDVSYSYLSDAVRLNDLDKFHFFLSNFGTWKKYHGIESNMLIRDNIKSSSGRGYLKSAIFHGQLKTWQWIYNGRKPISSLTYPTHGNQSGAYIDNVFVGVGSTYNEVYGSILSGWLDDIERPVVADLGAGYGKLAYFTLRNISDSCFIDFDLPETLCLAAYYLMKSWPNKKVLLYGEEKYSDKSHNQYDLIFMPSYEIERVGNNSIDLFMNKNSLGEMTKEAVTNYVNHIVKSTRYFFHMNHEFTPNSYSDGSLGLLGSEYPVPNDRFKLLLRYPEMGHIFNLGKVDYSSDIFLYLYERRKKYD